jgi:hypothetical protein
VNASIITTETLFFIEQQGRLARARDEWTGASANPFVRDLTSRLTTLLDVEHVHGAFTTGFAELDGEWSENRAALCCPSIRVKAVTVRRSTGKACSSDAADALNMCDCHGLLWSSFDTRTTDDGHTWICPITESVRV